MYNVIPQPSIITPPKLLYIQEFLKDNQDVSFEEKKGKDDPRWKEDKNEPLVRKTGARKVTLKRANLRAPLAHTQAHLGTRLALLQLQDQHHARLQVAMP